MLYKITCINKVKSNMLQGPIVYIDYIAFSVEPFFAFRVVHKCKQGALRHSKKQYQYRV